MSEGTRPESAEPRPPIEPFEPEVILKGVTDGITALDPSGRLLYANDAAVRLIGFPSLEALMQATPEERLSRFELLDASGNPLPLDQLPGRRALQGARSPEALVRFRIRETGEERWSIVKAVPVFDAQGQIRYAISFFQEITERKQAEEERARLLEREQAARAEAEAAQKRFAFLAEASSVLAASLDYEATLDSVARLAVPYLADWCLVDILDEDGGTIRQVAVAHLDPAKEELARAMRRRYPVDLSGAHGPARAIRTGRPSVRNEITDELLAQYAQDEEHLAYLRAQGPQALMILPLIARGRTLGAISFVSSDPGRRYEATETALAEDLARRAAMAVDNARLFREAREADRRKDEFLAMLSHELRNPLAPILNAVYLMKQREIEDATLHPRFAHARDVIERQVQHMARLVDELLDVSRLTRGKIELQKQSLDLAGIMARAVETSRPLIEAGRHELSVAFPPEPIALEADGDRLQQVLANLLNNAAKYTEPGGHIWLTGERDGNEAVLRVRDTGVGIPPHLLNRVFDLFVQADRSLDRSQGGLGIGLTLVRSLVEKHGGTVAAFSPGPGQGSEFVVRLPSSDS